MLVKTSNCDILVQYCHICVFSEVKWKPVLPLLLVNWCPQRVLDHRSRGASSFTVDNAETKTSSHLEA